MTSAEQREQATIRLLDIGIGLEIIEAEFAE